MKRALFKLIWLWFYPMIGIIYAFKDRECSLDLIVGFIRNTPYVWLNAKLFYRVWSILLE